MKLNLSRLLDHYYINESFLNKVIKNTNGLTNAKKAVKKFKDSRSFFNLIDINPINRVHNSSPECRFLNMYDRSVYLNEDDKIEYSIKMYELYYSHMPVWTEKKTVSLYRASNFIVPLPHPTAIMVRMELNYQYHLDESNLNFLASLKEEVSEETISNILSSLYLRLVGVPFDYQSKYLPNFSQLSVPMQVEYILEVLESSKTVMHLRSYSLRQTNYEWFIIYNIRRFLKTHDAAYLIKCCSDPSRYNKHWLNLQWLYCKFICNYSR